MRTHSLYFIRQTTMYDPETCFEIWTDIWVFGDIRGYSYVRTAILNAKGASKPLRLDAIPHHSHSMRVLVLPADRGTSVRPRVKLIERLIWDRDRLNMELVIYGNRPGYDRLAAVFQHSIDNPDDPSEHQHLDDAPVRGRWIVPRSVSLNVRNPLSETLLPQSFGFVFDTRDSHTHFQPHIDSASLSSHNQTRRTKTLPVTSAKSRFVIINQAKEGPP